MSCITSCDLAKCSIGDEGGGYRRHRRWGSWDASSINCTVYNQIWADEVGAAGNGRESDENDDQGKSDS